MREQVATQDLVAYFKALAASSMLVVSMSGPIFEIGSTIKSTYELAYIAETHQDFFGHGPYWIESRVANEWKDAQLPDPVIAQFAIAFAIHAKLARSEQFIGGYEQLLVDLANYEVVHKSDPKTNGGVGTLLVKQPSDTEGLRMLKSILESHSVLFTINDGSGYFNPLNTFVGNGLHS
ncbi:MULTISPECIES: hypothetical protein [unclassified Pseudomonas]|uniref:hypothetical protein n=1 Tax=unclassified Pseudomonas TaxID=196821 RepID=UPI000CD1D6EB|nr:MULTISPECIES: hypothetical protein [unclassified Pseudomonas]POA52094.1 hypothetical protein C1889_24160 [Pseudomonas sp. FW507-12TSA]